jgi:hypothetical protein
LKQHSRHQPFRTDSRNAFSCLKSLKSANITETRGGNPDESRVLSHWGYADSVTMTVRIPRGNTTHQQPSFSHVFTEYRYSTSTNDCTFLLRLRLCKRKAISGDCTNHSRFPRLGRGPAQPHCASHAPCFCRRYRAKSRLCRLCDVCGRSARHTRHSLCSSAEMTGKNEDDQQVRSTTSKKSKRMSCMSQQRGESGAAEGKKTHGTPSAPFIPAGPRCPVGPMGPIGPGGPCTPCCPWAPGCPLMPFCAGWRVSAGKASEPQTQHGIRKHSVK